MNRYLDAHGSRAIKPQIASKASYFSSAFRCMQVPGSLPIGRYPCPYLPRSHKKASTCPLTFRNLTNFLFVECLKWTVGAVLAKAVAETKTASPADPVQYLGQWLHRHVSYITIENHKCQAKEDPGRCRGNSEAKPKSCAAFSPGRFGCEASSDQRGGLQLPH